MEKEPRGFQAVIDELRSMVKIDQDMRKCRSSNPNNWDETVDRRNTERLKTIVDKIGWPSISKVGNEGSSNAWLLVQHADHDPEFQKRCLELMKSEPEGEISKHDIAYLEDWIAIRDGRCQIYGTHFSINFDGQLEPLPIEDPDNVDKRREEMGLETLSAHQKRMQEIYDKNNSVPRFASRTASRYRAKHCIY